jgi:predicted nucleic acid-binding protein
MAEVLIDTNILIYAHQPAERDKYRSALSTLEAVMESGLGRLSAQILAEFISATTRGSRPILTIDESLAQASLLAEAMPVLEITSLIVLEAGRGVRQHGLSYFDAQIWATARLNQIPTIFTEDFVNGRRIEGVQFLDPLASGFDLGPWSL